MAKKRTFLDLKPNDWVKSNCNLLLMKDEFGTKCKVRILKGHLGKLVEHEDYDFPGLVEFMGHEGLYFYYNFYGKEDLEDLAMLDPLDYIKLRLK